MTSNEVAQKLGPTSKMGRRISGTPGPSSEFKSEKHAVKHSVPTRRTCPQWVDATVNSPTADSIGKSRKSCEKPRMRCISTTARNHGELIKYGGNPVRVGNDRHRAGILRAWIIMPRQNTAQNRPDLKSTWIIQQKLACGCNSRTDERIGYGLHNKTW